MNRLFASIRFLTPLPLPGSFGADERSLAGSVAFFPIVGLLLGAAAAAAAWAMQFAAAPLLSAVGLVVLLAAFSGGLHADGLADTADGFLSSRPPERVLEIMKDSHVGAMGVLALVCVLLLKFAALATIAGRDGATFWRTALLVPLAGRAAMVVQMALLRYVRPTGLGSIFGSARRWRSAVWSAAVLGLAGWFALGWSGLAAAAASLVVAAGFAACCRRRIGGATGDTYGASCELAELVPPVVLAWTS